MLLKKILCPIDRSEDAIVGTAYAISLAREHKAELVIFHVTQFPWRKMTRYCQPEALLGAEWRSQLTVWNISYGSLPLERRALSEEFGG